MQKPNAQSPFFKLRAEIRCWSFLLRHWPFAFSLVLLSALQACRSPSPPIVRQPYIGPTDSMEQVVADINRNGQRIPTLWTQLNFTANFIDPDKHTADPVAGDGTLMYARPMSLLLNGDKDVAGQVFQLGSNDDEFWVKIRSGADAYNYWWGHYANLGKPSCRPIPIRPDLVLEVLGVGLFRTNFLVSPTPVMRFDNEADAYVFDLNFIATDHWETQEEIWYDRITKLPMKVILFGADGRAVLKADLSQHTPAIVPGIPRDLCPKIARHYDLFFADTGSKISFDLLNDPEVQHQGRHQWLPSAASFVRPEPDENNKVIQIDEGCK